MNDKILDRGDSIIKNIFVIQGGGRPNGNTSQLVGSFIKGAEDAGHSVECISLLKSEVKGCLGCNACRYGKPCIQKDAFNDMVPKITNANCIAFSSPLYFWTFEQAVSYYKFALVNYIGFRDKGMLVRNYTQDELAKRLNISRQAISKWERAV